MEGWSLSEADLPPPGPSKSGVCLAHHDKPEHHRSKSKWYRARLHKPANSTQWVFKVGAQDCPADKVPQYLVAFMERQSETLQKLASVGTWPYSTALERSQQRSWPLGGP